MPKVNLVSTRNSTVTNNKGTPDESRFWPYAPGKPLTLLNQAIFIIQNNIYKKNNSCNQYFSKLAESRSFDSMWADTNIWISYDPRTEVDYVGMSDKVGGSEIVITQRGFQNENVWYVVSIIVHELAHCAGAEGGSSMDAETSLKFCGLAKLYDPDSIGVSQRADNGQRVV